MMTNTKKYVWTGILLLVAVLSFTVVTRFAVNPQTQRKTIASLEEKKETVLELTAAATATAALITLIPGDVATPIAEKITDLTGYLLVVLCAIFLEKYLVTITGYAAFRVLIPAACLLLIAGLYWKREKLHKLACKLLLIGFSMVLVIPAGVKMSDMIEKTYETQIQSVIDNAKTAQDAVDEDDSAHEEETSEAESTAEKPGIWNQAKDFITGAKESVADTIESVSISSEELVKKVKDTLNHLIEAVAVMMITSCVIPILVLLFFVWGIKLILGLDLLASADKIKK